MKIKHVFHSGFEIELKDKIILIDVFDHFETYKNKKMFCFVTHGHGDHFSEKIFDLSADNEVTYVLSDDIKTNNRVDYYIKAGDQMKIGDLYLEVYGSTDLGVSLYFEVNGHTYFHSGDLNWWHWTSFTKDQLLDEERDFKNIVDKLVGKTIDFYFVPVDYRLKDYAHLAIDYVVDKIQPQYVIPMHFGDHFDFIQTIEVDERSRILKSHKINDVIYSK